MRKINWDATRSALERYDAIDRPAFEALANGATACDLAAFVAARHQAADRVRAAYIKDTADTTTPENLEVLSVEVIRRDVGGTPMGKMLALLP